MTGRTSTRAAFGGTDPTLRLTGAKPTSIRFIWARSSDHYAAWAQHFRQKGWFDQTYDYTCDEPPNGCPWSDINPRASMVHGADPEFRTLVTTAIDYADASGVTSSINILSPVVNFMDDKPGNSQFRGTSARSTTHSSNRTGATFLVVPELYERRLLCGWQQLFLGLAELYGR